MENLGKRLLRDLCKCFNNDPNIDEYDFLPIAEPTVNKNPFVIVHHKLGIESWAVKILFQYAYDRLMKSRPNKLASWNEFTDCSRAILMINADNQTAWNLRKLAIKKKLECPKADLKTNGLILRKHPKSPESFAHRKWVLNHLKETSADDLPSLSQEFEVCTRAAEGYANNYNAWSHRLWLMTNIAAWNTQVVEQELESTERFVKLHVSDHSGFHYRQQLLKSQPQRVAGELRQNTHSIHTYPGHEALWYHRRALIHQLLKNRELCSLEACASPDSPHPKRSRLDNRDGDSSTQETVDRSTQDTVDHSTQDTTINSTQDDVLKRNLLKQEEEFCDSVFKADTVENAEWQMQLARNYSRWLQMIQTT